MTATALLGCNALLGNEEGTPRETPVANADAAAPDAPAQTPTGDGGTPTSQECAAGEKRCFGACVPIVDPAFGCGADACTLCDPKNVTAPRCESGGDGVVCGYAQCDPTALDCNGTRSDGCETSKNGKDSCGACSTKCENATPLCGPDGAGGFRCASSCPVPTRDCNGSCVDTTNDVNHCGDCGKRCERAGAAARCVDGSCRFDCQPGLKACGEACVSTSDPAYCDNCQPCSQPLYNNQLHVCRAVLGCTVECSPGTYDCDGLKENGCESTAPCTSSCIDGKPCRLGQQCCPTTGCQSNLLPCPEFAN